MDTSVVKSAQIAIHTFTYMQSDSENDSEDDEEVDSMCFNIHAACKYYANIHTYMHTKALHHKTRLCAQYMYQELHTQRITRNATT